MKIAVITMHAVKNYGSVLQTYATQTILQRMGLDVEIIDYVREKNLDENLLDTWTKNDFGIRKTVKKAVLLPTVKRWKEVFGGYLEQEINLSKYRYTSQRDFDEHPVVADIYCTGSDQVWNSGWNNGIELPFFLTFAPDNSKKIALAASIGTTSVGQQEAEQIVPLLEKYTSISLREKSAMNVLKDIGIENTQFCLDPTLLLSCADWMQYAVFPKFKDPYVLVYQLNHDPEFDAFAETFTKQKGLKLYRICTRYDQVRLPGKPIVLPEVRELLGWFIKAEYIITNSFHATAFSINLNKQFISIYPDQYTSRISDVLTLFGLESRHPSSYDQFNIADQPIVYEIVNEILERERENSLQVIWRMIEDT